MRVHPRATLRTLTLVWAQKKIKRKDFEIWPAKIKAKSYRDRRGQAFAVRSFKLSGVHFLFY